MGALNAEVKVRLEEDAKAALEELGRREDRPPAMLARRFIRRGLIAAGTLEPNEAEAIRMAHENLTAKTAAAAEVGRDA